MPNTNKCFLDINKKIYDAIAPLYEERHSEIYNVVEQNRIAKVINGVIENIKTGSKTFRALDFGSGTGNLTRHLLNAGASVVASDVSPGCLREVSCTFNNDERLEISLLNGSNLTQFADESFDVVATYSVLHHVPDYLAIVSEFIRVVKPGGIIYIDHEVCPSYWENNPEYQAYCLEVAESQAELPNNIFQKVLHAFRQKYWWRYLVSLLWLKWTKVADEGDIHVHADDHIEWPEIQRLLEPYCEVLTQMDYLVCRERSFPAPAWGKWSSQLVDMRQIIALKR